MKTSEFGSQPTPSLERGFDPHRAYQTPISKRLFLSFLTPAHDQMKFLNVVESIRL